ncbi:MAG: VOC family protein [bacterium]
MLNIRSVNHIGIRIREKTRSIDFYRSLGFAYEHSDGFEQGHPIVMRHPSGVVLNLLGPANGNFDTNILMDANEKHTGITHFAMTVADLDDAKATLESKGIALTGAFSFGGMSAVFIRDPDRNVIELDAYGADCKTEMEQYAEHP